MSGEIIEDDNVAALQGWSKLGFDIGVEHGPVDWSVNDPRSCEPQRRKPAIKVCVPHLPKGAEALSRSPQGLRPRRRVIFVLVDVSSMKTSRFGSSRILGRRRAIQACRASFTSARSCSEASSVFFISKRGFAKEPGQRSWACFEAKGRFKLCGKFRHSDIGPRLDAPD